MPKHEFEDDELEGLSDDERAALESEDDEADILKDIAGDEEDDADEEESDEEQSESEEESNETADESPSDTSDEADESEPTAKQPEPKADFVPQFTASVPQDLTARLDNVNARFAELQQKLEDGDVSVAEYVVANQSLVEERMALKLAEEQAKWAQAQNASQRQQRWQWELERFNASESAAIYKDPIIKAALDVAVRQLDADPANASKPDAWFLEEADRQVRERMNLGAKPKAKAKQPDLSGLPKTLANLPAAELSETGADEFAYLEKLLDKDVMAYEAALRKLTPEQEARYLGAA